MLSLQTISLTQFKNYSNRSFDFTERIVGICGKNGAGKTNLLDAIHYLCFTRSYFTRLDSNNVQQGNNGFRIEGHLVLNDKPEKAICILREFGRKEFSVNDDVYDKFSRHIGRYPCVVIAPDDAQLITGDSRERRSFIDALLSQLDAEYLQHLITYQKILVQRNSLLKSFAETKTKDLALLDVLDQQLIPSGDFIFTKRKEFFISFLPLVKHLYHDIAFTENKSATGNPAFAKASAGNEDLNLFYESEMLQASLEELLNVSRNKDMMAQRTTSGIHRDDIEIQLSEKDFKTIASQGQRKSLLFALKLAEMEILKREKHFAPLLLLDDVFEKLDEDRISNLLNKVCVENDGHVFITDTNEERLAKHLEELQVSFQLISL